MKNWINDRKKEITTWTVGIPALLLGLGTLFKADHSEQVGAVVAGAGEHFVAGNWTQGLMMVGLGIVGIFAREK